LKISEEVEEAINRFTLMLCEEICEDLVEQSVVFLTPEEKNMLDLDQFKIYASLGGTQMVKNLMDKKLIDLDELMKYVKQ
tara:strand:+ start:655 stop:894 length:240 start_codon:yes stop_codon:yes gene_type:complete